MGNCHPDRAPWNHGKLQNSVHEMRWGRGEKKRKKIRENGERGWLKTTVNFETTRFFLRCSSKRAVRERRSTTSHPPRFSLTFYFENGETSFLIPLLLVHPPPPPLPPSSVSILRHRGSLEKIRERTRSERGEESRGNKRARSKRATGAHWTELIIFMTLHDDEMAVQKMRCLSLPRYLKREEEEEEKSFAGRPLRCR